MIAAIADTPVAVAIGFGTTLAQGNGSVAPVVVPSVVAVSVEAHGVADGDRVADGVAVTGTVDIAVDLADTAVVSDARSVGVPVIFVVGGGTVTMVTMVGVAVDADRERGSAVAGRGIAVAGGVAVTVASSLAMGGRGVALTTTVAEDDAETATLGPGAASTEMSVALQPINAINAARPRQIALLPCRHRARKSP